MEIVYDEEGLCKYMRYAAEASDDQPVLIDKFLEEAAVGAGLGRFERRSRSWFRDRLGSGSSHRGSGGRRHSCDRSLLARRRALA